MKKLAFIFFLGFLSVGTSMAHAETTEVLLSNCRPITQAKLNATGGVTMETTFENGFCWGTFATLDQMLMALDGRTNKPMFNVCIPKEHTRYQMIAIFVRYADKHPERWHEDSPWVAFDAAREAFPCKS